MQKHVKIYLDHFGYSKLDEDFIPCEVCRSKSVDIHHINYRSRGGDDSIENLMALCRSCHDTAHREEFSPEFLNAKHMTVLIAHKFNIPNQRVKELKKEKGL